MTAGARALAAIVGVVSSLILVSFAINRVRDEAGTAAAGLSFGAGFVVYVVLIVLLMSTLPRGTTDPGAILPGAAVVATVIVGMQMFSQLYIPGKVADASDLYGGVGIAVVALGWLFIFGRSLSFAFSVNAALFERFGSLSTPIFALPVLRLAAPPFTSDPRVLRPRGRPEGSTDLDRRSRRVRIGGMTVPPESRTWPDPNENWPMPSAPSRQEFS